MSTAANKVYARVSDEGKILEYPVFPQHIEARGHPLEWYVQVEFAPKPEVPEFYWLKEVIVGRVSVSGVKHADVTYEVVPYTLAELVSGLVKESEIPGMPSNTPKDISEISMAVVNRVAHLASEHAKAELDKFVKTRNYDNAASAVTYKDSKIPTFAAEAARVFEIRDNMYAALYDYLGKVTSGQLPVPITAEEIFAILPELTWE